MSAVKVTLGVYLSEETAPVEIQSGHNSALECIFDYSDNEDLLLWGPVTPLDLTTLSPSSSSLCLWSMSMPCPPSHLRCVCHSRYCG